MKEDILLYHSKLSDDDRLVCDRLHKFIMEKLMDAENKVWHAHPVWFLDGNPIVGYSKLKSGIKFMFWSGMSFEEKQLIPGTGKFKDASITYTDITQLNRKDIHRWLEKAREIQWDYKNIVKRRGRLERLK